MGAMADDRSGYQLWIVYLLVVFYAVCYQLQSPLEPFLVEKLIGKDKGTEVALQYGRLQSFFNVIQMIGSLVFGHILDRCGVRVGFLVNFTACALTYGLLANTSTIGMLFLSKVPGMGMAGFLCAQTAVSQLTPKGPARVAALGRLTTSYTIGGVIGPYIGGQLGSRGDYFLSAKVAVVGSVLAAGLSLLLPGSVKTEDNEKKDVQKDKDETPKLPWVSRVKMILKVAGFLTFVKLVTGTANSMASSSQSLILKNELAFTEADLGKFMSAQFGFGGFANAFLLAPLTKFLGGDCRIVVRNCVGILCFGYCIQAGLNSPSLGILAAIGGVVQRYSFIVVAMFLSIFQYSLSTSITAANTEVVSDDMKGTLIGLEHCIFSAARIVTPAVGVKLFMSGGVSLLYATCACIFFSVLILWTLLAARFLPTKAKVEKKND